MKGERVPTESSEYEASDDERMKRRGVSGGLGRGKVMKGEEEGKFAIFFLFSNFMHVSGKGSFHALLEVLPTFALFHTCAMF